MNWKQLVSTTRLGQENYTKNKVDIRTEFQMDYDRLIFSSPFRRLQHKTQVFPLPSGIFVHNRLTHSLEVASVGRSLGNLVATSLEEKHNDSESFLELGSIVSASCLAHDLGNPPFGHSGEDAISNYFITGNGLKLKEYVSDAEWADLQCFEGNANALRLLTHSFAGRRKGGYALTYSTLASIVKYPYASIEKGKKRKYGYFQSEEETYIRIAKAMGLERENGTFKRHPLVYLVEASDDICYQVMDIEDAYRLKILSFEETADLFKAYFAKDEKAEESITKVFNMVQDADERIAYLRSKVIGKLNRECANVFLDNEEKILQGEFNSSLIKACPEHTAKTYEKNALLSINKIYKHPMVVEIEVSAYRIIEVLLDRFIMAVLEMDNAYAKSLRLLIPTEYTVSNEATTYEKIRAVIDFISGMTDDYALNTYRTLEGVQLPYSKRVF